MHEVCQTDAGAVGDRCFDRHRDATSDRCSVSNAHGRGPNDRRAGPVSSSGADPATAAVGRDRHPGPCNHRD